MSVSGVTHIDVVKISEVQTDSDVAETRVNLDVIDEKYEHVISKCGLYYQSFFIRW